jgi:hypothetical protein
MIVISLLGLFFGAVYESLLIGLRATTAAHRREDVRRQLSRAMDQLTREIAAAYDVDDAEDQRFQFDARDINGDGSDDTNINYRVASGDLERVEDGVTVVLIRDLASLDFDYVDDTGATLSTPVSSSDEDDIRIVQITLTAASGAESISLAAAYLRNM